MNSKKQKFFSINKMNDPAESDQRAKKYRASSKTCFLSKFHCIQEKNPKFYYPGRRKKGSHDWGKMGPKFSQDFLQETKPRGSRVFFQFKKRNMKVHRKSFKKWNNFFIKVAEYGGVNNCSKIFVAKCKLCKVDISIFIMSKLSLWVFPTAFPLPSYCKNLAPVQKERKPESCFFQTHKCTASVEATCNALRTQNLPQPDKRSIKRPALDLWIPHLIFKKEFLRLQSSQN